MRSVLLGLMRVFQAVMNLASWCVFLASMLRFGVAIYPPGEKIRLAAEYARAVDPYFVWLATALGLKWPAQTMLGRFFPAALAVVALVLKSYLGKILDSARFRLLESQIVRRRKARPSAGDRSMGQTTVQAREKLLDRYREIQQALQSPETKSCTFLNIDVVGSTKMKSGETPTNIAASFQAYEELLKSIFKKHGAWKQAWTPDGVLICFQESDPAAEAAREVLRRLPEFNKTENRMRSPFRVRCGVNQGNVAIFDDTKFESFSDPVIDVAGLMQKHARPNAILLGEKVYSALRAQSGFEETGEPVDEERTFEWSLEPGPSRSVVGRGTVTTSASNPASPPMSGAMPIAAAGRPQPAPGGSVGQASNQPPAPSVSAARQPGSAVQSTMAAPPRIGRYEIEQELGCGAMGAVYKAVDPQIGRTVALKVMVTRGLSGEELELQKQRFSREARAAGKLLHPGIVAIYDVAEDAVGAPFMVMEFVDGSGLDKALETGGSAASFTYSQRLALGIEIAEALEFAHRHGVIHRDLKPSNVLLTRDGHCKLADFGIAKLVDGQGTVGGQFLGTPAFVSPEQLTGTPADSRSDIFSLGVVLYWMFTGERPFNAESMTALSYKVVHAMPAPARQLNWALPEELDTMLFRCLAKNPADRYQTAAEVAGALRRLQAVRPTASASPAS